MEFLAWMFVQNVYLYQHFVLSLVYSFLVNYIFKKDFRFIFSSVFIVSLLWELFEFVTSDITIIYGSKLHWFADSLGDILIALLATLLFRFVFYKNYKG